MAPGSGRGLEAAPPSPGAAAGTEGRGARRRAAALAAPPEPRCPCPPCPARPAVTRRPRRAEPPPSAPAITKLSARPGRRRRLPAHGTASPALSPASTPGRDNAPRERGQRGDSAGSGDSAAVTGTHRGAPGRTGQSGEGRPEAAEPVPMCPRSRRGGEAAMSAAGAVRPWKPDPGQAGGGRPPGPALPLTLSVLAWLGTGTTMAGLNKWIFAAHGFRYPLLLSALHMLSGVAVGYPLGWARAPGPRPRARIYLLSLTFCTSVALGNLGLSYVQLDVAQAVATTTPLVTLLLGLLAGRRPHPLQFWAMGPVCAGAACSIAGGLCFSQPGCGFLLAATVLRALKSIQQSVLLQEDHLDALSLLGLTSLPSFVLLFGAAVALELGPSWQGVLRPDAALWGCVLLSCLGSVLYNLATSCLLSLTSALTLHLLGSLTVVGNLLLSWLLFGTRLGALGYAGVALTLAGMVLYHQPRLLAACWGLPGLRRHPRHQ